MDLTPIIKDILAPHPVVHIRDEGYQIPRGHGQSRKYAISQDYEDSLVIRYAEWGKDKPLELLAVYSIGLDRTSKADPFYTPWLLDTGPEDDWKAFLRELQFEDEAQLRELIRGHLSHLEIDPPAIEGSDSLPSNGENPIKIGDLSEWDTSEVDAQGLADTFPEGWKALPEINTSALDTQVGGDHYSKLAIQPVEYITKNKLSYLEGNVIKYITRHRFKGGKEDLRKAQHYINMILEMEYEND